METIGYILKGLLIGIGKVIPGVSGSLIAYSLGLYEPCIEAISNFFKDFKNNVLFLGRIGLGIVIAVVFGSHLISFCLSRYYVITMLLFIGLIVGSFFPLPFHVKKKEIPLLLVIVILSSFFLLQTKGLNYVFAGQAIDYVYILFIGFLDAVTMIVPGLSGTALFMVLGCYQFLLNVFQNIFSYFFTKPLVVITLFLGLLLGIIITSKLVNYFFKCHKHLIEIIILGFSISSILFLLLKTFIGGINIIQLIIGILFFMVGYIISFYPRS